MADVKRSIVITPEQDRWIDKYAERHDVNRSWVVRRALDEFMQGGSPFLPRTPANGETEGFQQETVGTPA